MSDLVKKSEAIIDGSNSIEVHFENIKNVLLEHINKATKSIHVAVAWFNDEDLFEALKYKVEKDGVGVKILVSGKQTKTDKNSELDFIFFQDHELCKYYCMPKECSEFLHHKFCVIDERILITGSYNWTYAASSYNLENIVIVENKLISSYYINEFNEIVYKFIEEPIEKYIKHIRDKYEELGERLEVFFETLKQSGNIERAITRIGITYNISPFLPQPYSPIKDNAEYYLKNQDARTEWWESLDLQWKLFFNKSEMSRNNCSEKISDVAIEAIFKKTELDCSNSNLTSLNGIVKLTNLFSLNCSANQIGSLKPLELLKNLYILNCSANKLQSIDFDSNTLYTMDCSNNYDINELPSEAEFESLYILNCSNTSISNFNVNGFKKITQLYFSETNVAILDSVKKFQSLNKLVCSSNGIEDIRPLAELLQITYLDVSNNSLTYLYGLENLVNITHLCINGNHIKTLSMLDNLPNLKFLKITNRAATWAQDNEIFDDKLTNFKNQRFGSKKEWKYERKEYDQKRNAWVVKENFTLKL